MTLILYLFKMNEDVENFIIDLLAQKSADLLVKEQETKLIAGTALTGKLFIQMSELMKTLSKISLREYASEITRHFKQYAIGLNAEQLRISNSVIENISNGVIESLIHIITNCGNANWKGKFLITKTDGTLIKRDVFLEMREILKECVLDAISTKDKLVKTITEFENFKSLPTERIQLNHIVVIVAVIVIMTVGIKYDKKMLFSMIITIIIGIYLLMTSNRTEMSLNNFSNTISYNDGKCKNISSARTIKDLSTVEEAEKRCLEDSKCDAFDFHHKNDVVRRAYATFYTDIGGTCKTDIEEVDSVSLPDLTFKSGIPDEYVLGTKPGDVYVDKETSIWYQLDRNKKWHSKIRLTDDEFDELFVSLTEPNKDAIINNRKSYYIWLNDYKWKVYKPYRRKWSEAFSLAGPSLFVYAPSNVVSGFKVFKRKKWSIFIGVLTIVVGLLSFIINLIVRPF